eukprot:gene372-57_t
MEGIQNSLASSSIGQKIGRTALQSQFNSTMSSFNIGAPTPGPQAAQSSINWTDYNYPPCVNIIHYDKSELPSEITWLVRLQNLVFLGTAAVCTLNIVDTFIIIAAYPIKNGGLHVLYTFLNFILLNSLAFWIFYKGYSSVACQDTPGVAIYKWLQIFYAVLAFIFMWIPNGAFALWSNMNGFGTLMDSSRDTSGFFVFAVVFESFLWAAVCIVSVLAVVKLMRTDIYSTSGIS